MLVVTLLTSEGAAGVTGSSFTALAATVPHVPVGTLALIFGVSRFMSETRSLTSLAGNGVATLAAARWEDELDEDRARSVLRGGRPYTPGLAPTAAPPASLAAGPNRFTFEACGPSPCRGILCPNTAAWTVWPLSGLDGVRLVERQHGEGGQPVVGGEAAAFHGGQTHGEVCVGLGSHSTDLLSGLGPEPLRAGDVLPLGAPTGRTALPGAAPRPAPPAELVLPLRPGPRADWFTAAALRTLFSATYRVCPHSNRVGLRTEGPAGAGEAR